MKTADLQPAYLLHRRDYRNTSLLLDVYSRDYGRRSLVAKGARGRGGAGNVLRAFVPLLLSWRGRGDLQTLTAAESVGDGAGLQGSELLCGFYLNELLLRVLANDDPDADLFQNYAQTLLMLQAGGCSQAAVLRQFELKLLDGLGYGLILEYCVDDGMAIDSERIYRYRLEHGPVPYRPGDGDGIRVTGSTLIGLAGADLDEAGHREALALLRAALAPHLGGRPLHSRRLYGEYLRLRR
jgi:DNA repair protein RecO (recombination protein O)